MTTVSDFTAILSPSSWSQEAGTPAIVTYSFNTSAQPYLTGNWTSGFLNSFQTFSGAEQTLARSALAQWADVCGIIFVEAAAGQGDIQFGKFDFNQQPGKAGALAFDYPPLSSGLDPKSGDIFINTNFGISESLLLREVGRVLGLKHAADSSGPVLTPSQDTFEYTVMASSTGGFPGTALGIYDVQAVNYMYGPQSADGTGVESWSWNAGTQILMQVGKSGDDMLRGVYSGNIMKGGAGNDAIFGNIGADVIDGEAGADYMDGGDGADVLTGGDNVDRILGGSGDDIIFGGDHSDSLEGGAGNDTIDGGQASDVSGYRQSRFTYAVSKNSDGSFTVRSAEGVDTLYNIEYLSFSDTPPILVGIEKYWMGTNRQANDFDGNRKADLLMQYNDGRLAIWLMDGAVFAGGGLVGSPGAAWHAKDAGDFDGNGKSDILMQHDDSSIAVWLVNDTSFAGGNVIGNAPGTSWHVKAAADFSSDGKADIVMQHDDSRIAIWEVHDLSFAGGVVVSSAAGVAWKVKGAGDFDRNGKNDLVLQRDTGEIAIWWLNGTDFGGGALAGNPGASWHVKAVADFDGDQNADLLLQHDDSSVAVWRMLGSTMAGAALIATPGVAWQVQGASDYDGNGTADIVLQNNHGETAIWRMSGTTRLSEAVAGNPGALWSLVGPTGA